MDSPAPMSSVVDFVDELRNAQFIVMDAFRRSRGDALEALGFGPRECDHRIVASGPHWRLRAYSEADERPPLLLVPAPIKRPYIWDLTPSTSAVRHCLDQGSRVYLLEWTPPTDRDRSAGLEDYAYRAVSDCVAAIENAAPGAKPSLIGHSLGGTLAAIFCALDGQSVRRLVLLGSPLCFAPRSSRFRDALVSLLPATISTADIVPGSLLSHSSALASPETFVWERLRDAVLCVGGPPALAVGARVERWALDEVPLPGRLVAEIAQLLYREDRFYRGSLSLCGRRIGPSDLMLPTLAVVDTADEIAPLDSVKPFLDATPARTDVIEYPGETGVALQHLALLAGPRAHAEVWPRIFAWLQARD
ncbi:MAG: poly(3-hydroxyalkanoate) synthetase-like protein [Methylocystaceae bacterium]|nr:MAG: poly(3-hydroxyalkanoate) synthetase-like protein [Methylocystaceae bacterium]